MKYKKGESIELKGLFSGARWREFHVLEDIDTENPPERLSLYDPQEREEFKPLFSRCKIRRIR